MSETAAEETDASEEVIASTEGTAETVPEPTVDIAALRRENASWRTKLREREAADEQFKKTIGKALGLTQDEADPVELTNQLTKAQSDARQRAVELAVFRAAGKNGADGDALLDSRTFLSSVNDLDPSAGDFNQQVADAVLAAITSNARLKTGPAPAARSGAEFTSAPAGPGAQWTQADVEKAASEGRNEDINAAREKGLLRNLLGG